jgi:hypothetical protein
MQDKLHELLERNDPELFLVLETDNNDVQWKCFRTRATFHGTKEEGIASLYLAHVAQWSQKRVYTLDGSLVPLTKRLVLDPRDFVEFLEMKRDDRANLMKIIDMSEIVLLNPLECWKDDWRNRYEVLKSGGAAAACSIGARLGRRCESFPVDGPRKQLPSRKGPIPAPLPVKSQPRRRVSVEYLPAAPPRARRSKQRSQHRSRIQCFKLMLYSSLHRVTELRLIGPL